MAQSTEYAVPGRQPRKSGSRLAPVFDNQPIASVSFFFAPDLFAIGSIRQGDECGENVVDAMLISRGRLDAVGARKRAADGTRRACEFFRIPE